MLYKIKFNTICTNVSIKSLNKKKNKYLHSNYIYIIWVKKMNLNELGINDFTHGEITLG